MTKNLGMLCLAIYLILISLGELVHLSLGSLNILIPILALAAGVLLLLGR